MKSYLSRLLVAIGAAWFSLLVASASYAGAGKAGSDPVHPPVLKSRTAKAGGYFVEFASRPTEYFGHSFVRLGTTSKKGDTSTAIAGLYPDPKRAKSIFNDVGIVGYTTSDVRHRPSAQYRVAVSKQTYEKTKRYLADLPKTRRRYDLLAENCNHLMADVADKLGLKVSGEPNDMPDAHVRAMKTLNEGRTRASWRGKPPKSKG